MSRFSGSITLPDGRKQFLSDMVSLRDLTHEAGVTEAAQVLCVYAASTKGMRTQSHVWETGVFDVQGDRVSLEYGDETYRVLFEDVIIHNPKGRTN